MIVVNGIITTILNMLTVISTGRRNLAGFFTVFKIIAVIVIFCLSVISCSTTKYIPEGKYLLDAVDLKIDTKDVSKVEMEPFIQQTPNDPKFRLKIYNMVEGDTNKWFDRKIRKIGEPPVIYNRKLEQQSVRELTIEMKNKGYLNAKVTSEADTADKKAKVAYFIESNEPYRIRSYEIRIPDTRIDSILQNRRSRNVIIRPGSLFDMSTLEKERSTVNSLLRNQGYFTSTESNLHYLADTTLNSHQVDLTLVMNDASRVKPYYINKVTVYSGVDPLEIESYKIVDSIHYKGITIFYDSVRFLRPSVINNNIMIRSGEFFRENRGNRTYNNFNQLGNVGRTNVQYVERNYPDSTLLDCDIYLTPGNIHSMQAGLDGTNKAGDLGVAANVSYGHHNLFNGAEWFNIRIRGAYEFVRAKSTDIVTHDFYEFGINPTLTFPKLHLPFIGKAVKDRFHVNTRYGIGFDVQKRPEYTREFFNLNWTVLWNNERQTISQSLSLLDINYVMMPWKSGEFQNYLNHHVDSLTKYSYEDIFTAGIGYSLIFTNRESGRYRQRLYTIRFNAESSGNVLKWMFDLSNAKKSSSGQYTIFGNPFAQYVKGDMDFSQTIPFDRKNTLAFHAAIGVAYPYGKSTILPGVKRYYAGGPTSIRGWSTRYLGPGSYSADEGDPTNHVGDIRMELSGEYRYKWINWLELAAFIDAGNIWTIKNYADQPGGYFQLSRFYKEPAIGTGVGFRIDLGFLIIRLDGGTRVYDPALPEGNRWTFLKGNFSRNSAFYLAIGYPF
ncbi:MAG: BamA/TamA family outer membrane protein [Dysgonamonadaceae bacterium]|jgi:outer membrane protein assembly factor BamA|nr:BamA/TamA family outer membrane protein [Dysgonamonadaceae bacterium]